MKSKRRKLTKKLIEKRMKREDEFLEKSGVTRFDKKELTSFILKSIIDRISSPMMLEQFKEKDMGNNDYYTYLTYNIYDLLNGEGLPFNNSDDVYAWDSIIKLRDSIKNIETFINGVINNVYCAAKEIYANKGIEDLVRYIRNPDLQKKYHGE